MKLIKSRCKVSLLAGLFGPFSAMLLSSLSLGGGVLVGPVDNPANGHSYYLLNADTWPASQVQAVALGGNLVTITSPAENDWVFDTFSAGQRNLWIGLNDIDRKDIYSWVDGTPCSYANWDLALGQPDLGGQQPWVFIVRSDLGHNLAARKWHNIGDNAAAEFPWVGPVFGVVKTVCVPHGAVATVTVVNGFVVGAAVNVGGCGYTSVPLVMITGDGTGATATATVTNGVVTAIQIVNPGSGYTANTEIKIASPPFTPWLEIDVSKVKVTQHVVLGKNYVLESSTDAQKWNQVGPRFTAQDEVLSQEFDVDSVGRFFRIQQVP